MTRTRPPLPYRLCLRLLPREFRRRHGATIASGLLEDRPDHGLGPTAGARFWTRACADVVRGVIPAWRRVFFPSVPGDPGNPGPIDRVSWQRDLVFGFRSLRRDPSTTGLCLLAIALGIGANGAVFTLVNEILLRPLPVHEPTALSVMHVDQPGANSFSGFSLPELVDYRERSAGIAGLAAASVAGLRLGESRQIPVVGSLVSAGYFELFGVEPARGRVFTPREAEVESSDSPLVISHGLWQRQFAGDPAVVGNSILLDGRPFTVIGIMPPSFTGPFIGFPVEVWLPLAEIERLQPGESLQSRTNQLLEVFVRRAEGFGLAATQDALNVVAGQLEQAFPEINRDRRVRLSQLTGLDDSLRGGVLSFLGILLTLSGLVLLTACLNVGNLLLARGQSRRAEIATRMALGAGRGRIVRQLLTETLLLFLVGAILAVALAWQINVVLRRFIDSLPAPLGFQLDLDPAVLGMTGVAALVTALITGLSPALRATRESQAEAIRAARSGDHGAARLRQLFVVGQVAVSLVLLTAAGLFLRALERGQRLDPGFSTAGLSVATIGLPDDRYSSEQALLLFAELEDRLASAPGVLGAALAQSPPLGVERTPTPIQVPGLVPPDGQDAFVVDGNRVSARYFSTVGIEIVRGRAIEASDRTGERRVAVVNEHMAATFWGGDQAVGQQLLLGGDTVEVVGVARDTRHLIQILEPGPLLYLASAQHPDNRMGLILRSTATPAEVARSLTIELGRLDATLDPPTIRGVDTLIVSFLLPQRIASRVAGAMGLVGLVLAISGVYGIMAYSLGQRRRELAIRMALGGKQGDVTGLVIRSGLKLVGAGTAVGLVGALLIGGLLRGFLAGVTPFDPLTLGVVVVGLFSTAMFAAWIPARWAARIAPAEALRES